MRRRLAGGAVLAVLWIACGWISFGMLRAGGSIATLGELVPSPMARGVFGSPPAWAVLVQCLTVIAVVTGFALISFWFARGGRTTFATGWITAVLIGFGIGAALDLGSFFAWLGDFGVRGALRTMGATQVTAWWAVTLGWIPALVAREPGDSRRAADAPPGRSPWFVVALIAAASLIALPIAAEAGHDATQQQLRVDQAQAEAAVDPDGAAPADPDAPGVPVPSAAPADGPSADGACTARTTTIMTPPPDAATGHRGQVLQLVNTSDASCTLDGYPDVAYGDQNGHLLDVAIDHGGSFMAQDPGPESLTLQPGDSAFAAIGWDANSMHGQLVASTVWVAVRPGEARLSWDMRLDIVPGVTVHVTAWQFGSSAAG
ncbi:DUF4232 domain-containing protein [Microbacterium sp. NPDC058345]|uniref:DUF4232 domain-containing protein n=1 Tax=Microbacterium sp. NPDC058345 TaxID=3346455 RepID=UPI003667BA39